MKRPGFFATALLLAGAAAVPAQTPAPVLPPGEKEPVLRVEAEGPTAYVTALAFNRDGDRLYAAGWDKVVRVWARDGDGRFVVDRAAYRVPVGPGSSGAINAIALSDDGDWLAVGGVGTFRGQAGFRQDGGVYSTNVGLGPEMRKDVGTIYVFNTRTGAVNLLRGHLGPVCSVAFAPTHAGKPPLLVSAASDWNAKTGRFEGSVCLWDVRKVDYITYVWGLPPPEVFRPGLAVWHTGPKVTDLRVALAWDDGKFRVWQVEKDELHLAEHAVHNVTAAYDPGRERVVTAVYGSGAASLTLWDASGDTPAAKWGKKRRNGPADCIPRALALASSRANGTYDLAAVVNVTPKQAGPPKDEAYSLQLLDLRSDSLGEKLADVPLWTGGPKQPVLAAAPNGKYLAVAGNDSHDIRVYAIAGLLEGVKKVQTLRGAGLPVRYAAFVKKGDEAGLLLNESAGAAAGRPPRDPAVGDLVFDLGKRRLSADHAGWRTDAPALAGWRTERLKKAEQAGPGVAVYRGDELVRSLRLPPEAVPDERDYEVTAWALLPPGPGRKVPLLALAWHSRGQPTLALYNVTTGDKLRHLTSHVERVTSLAFSGDGRLLASAGEDQTVCVWSLASLDKVLGRLGRLPGLTVGRDKKDRAFVYQIDKDSPAAEELREQDLIEAVIVGSRTRPVPSVGDYYEAISGTTPGTKVKLRVRGEAGAREATLEVGQGVDERKPLFSLFVTAGAKDGERDWIGWTPIGPYESSGARVERYLGWHFNTGEAAAPTRFALAGEYRPKYYREGLLKELVTNERVPPAPPKPAPQVGLGVKDDDDKDLVPDARKEYLVRSPDVKLRLSVGDRSLDTLEAVTWQIDDGAKHKLDLKDKTDQDTLLPLELKRGVQRVRVTVRTPDTEPREVVREMSLRYQPPAPHVEARGVEPRSVVKKAAFTLRANVRPGRPDEAVTVTLTHRQGDKLLDSKKYEIVDGKPPAVEWPLTLKTGTNLVEIVAVNSKAEPEDRKAETDRLVLEVTLTEKPPPPEIVLSVLPGADGAGKIAAEPGREVLVRVPRVRLAGEVTPPKNLAEPQNLAAVEWARDKEAKFDAATGFVADKAKEFAINEEVKLKPGRQTLRFRARTADSDPAERELTIFYQPPLPHVVLTDPDDDKPIYGEAGTAVVSLEARLTPPDDNQLFKAEVLVDGKKAEVEVIRDAKGETLKARVPVKPGVSRLQVRLSNEWEAVLVSEPVRLRYARPPTFVKMSHVSAADAALHDFRAEVRSPLPLLEPAVLEVNGKARPAKVSFAAAAAKGTWDVRVQGVALEEGKNEVRLRLRNDEGECREPGAVVVNYKPDKPVPFVVFLSPADNGSVTEPLLKVRFRVRSASRIEAVRLLRGAGQSLEIDVAGQKGGDGSEYELIAQQDVRLAPGDNALRLEARNAGGVSPDARLVMTYQRPPVDIHIDAIAVRGEEEPLKPKELAPNGVPVFPSIPKGRVRLQGSVRWGAGDDERLGKAETVRVFVNGFQQLPARLGPRAKDHRERAFEADLLLNQAGKNRIELGLPGLETDAASCRAFDVDCPNPERAQRLHLLIVSAREKDAEPLRTQFLKAIQSEESSRGELKTPAFRPVYLYGPLVGSAVRRERINEKLFQIKNSIKGLAVSSPNASDVVVFYYRGEEMIDDAGNVLKMTGGHSDRGSRETDLTCDYLAKFFADTPGAHVLLFDVNRAEAKGEAGRDKVAKWDDNFPDVKSHVAVLRIAFLGRSPASNSPALVKALEEVMPKSTHLIEVANLIDRSVSAEKGTQTKFDKTVPGPLGGMTVNGEKR